MVILIFLLNHINYIDTYSFNEYTIFEINNNSYKTNTAKQNVIIEKKEEFKPCRVKM